MIKHLIAGLLTGYAVSSLILLAQIRENTYAVIHDEAMTVCEEDMQCWDCSTMGNRLCGPGYGVMK